MTADLRVIVDTSVLVSALLLPHGKPRRAFELARRRGVILVSEATILEVAEVLTRPKFNRYLPEALRLDFLAELVQQSSLVEVRDSIVACRDPKDDKFLELAISGCASHILSGDADLLALHPFRGVEVVTPEQFLIAVASP